ncbi:hypothetical protein [Vibrio diabolicus]|uniref:hypothetical protein n=1 Tax=Vibrio diabolicus TaxID=50719 RepID=UPI00215DEB14|nr:hypothetical protein [Vibrio diabolicus]MCS0429320.1 hypothetical protein [Vibrio diabolicus]
MANKLALSNIAVYPSSHFSINNNSNALLFGFGIIPTPKIEKHLILFNQYWIKADIKLPLQKYHKLKKQ